MSECGRWNWVAVVASLMMIWLLVSDRASGQDLKVTFPPKKRTGKLTLTVQVNPADFPATGTATLEVETKSGPADLILGGGIPYSRRNSTLQTEVDFFRDGKDALNFGLKLRV